MLATSAFLLITTILLGIFTIIGYNARRSKLTKFASTLSGPLALPILGNALLFAGKEEDVMQTLMSLAKQYSICRIWLGPHLTIVSDDPDHIKTVLVDNRLLERGFIVKYFLSWLGTGLVTVPGIHWAPRRKLIGSTFNTMILRNFCFVFAEQSKTLVEQLEAHEGGDEFDILHYVSLCTFDMICETTMGVKMGSQTAAECSFKTATDTLMNISSMREHSVFLHPDVIFNLTPYARQEREAIKMQTEYAEVVIRAKREAISMKRQESEIVFTVEDEPSTERKALLDLLLELADQKEDVSNKELLYEMNTMLTAGSDTTSAATTFALLMLAWHPDVQEKVYQELREIYGHDERAVGFDDLKQMIYLERVVKETLRLFPAVPFMCRDTTEDTKMHDDVVPKDCTFFMMIITIHRNPKFWPDPMKFDPDRFLPENIEARHPYAYMPFGAGPRNCVGSRYAMLAVKTICATILRRYILKSDRITPIDDIKLQARLSLRACETIKLRIEKRAVSQVGI